MDEEPAVKRPATYQDVIDAPEHLIAEILDSELILSHHLPLLQSHAQSRLLARLARAFDEGYGNPGGWLILHSPELHIGPDVVVPDIAGWKSERVPELPEAFFPIAPDWACEILSPVTERIDRLRKLRIYAREGVSHLWLLNPALRLLETFRRVGDAWLETAVYGDVDGVRVEPFEAIEIDLSDLWI